MGFSLKDKKRITITNAFQKNLDNSNRKLSRILVDKGCDIEKYSTHNVKNVYIDKLDDIVNEYNNTYHRTNVDVESSTCNDFGKEKNDKDLKFKIGDHVRI